MAPGTEFRTRNEQANYMTTNNNVEAECAVKKPADTACNHMPLFQVFLFLQLLDLLTTIVVLRLGGYESNPLVGYFMTFGPVGGLVMAKALVVAVGAAIVWYNRQRVVFLANYAYAGVVCWNLAILAIS
jgi:hypothetical protein